MAEAPQSVLKLVERFELHRDAYRRGRYGETEVRVELIDPLFVALGWDVRNEAGYAEAYKDVIHEDAIKVGGSTKAPDYCFRIGGTRKFFLEAKKPSVDIHGEPGPAYQLRRYAWSAKLPLSILTDFEELAVYDCRTRPKPADKAATARTMYFQYTDYPEKWDEIDSVFSKRAVLEGSFDKYVIGRRKRGTAEVDAEFLKEIETWRDALARNIALRNGRLSVRQLNYAVQRTIDRIIFLRICEDRGVETYGSIQGLIGGPNVYPRLMELFRAADDRYNSGLFHFREERGRATEVDTLTPDLAIDDKVLKDIFRSLYYPASPYEFSVIPADILGNVYEQFLGKVIHLTKAHYARVEAKPEVKKAGGVYYTPKYIVDYIVRQTVGKLLLATKDTKSTKSSKSDAESPPLVGFVGLVAESLASWKTPRQVSRLRVLDPACGSGSFLVGAYKLLLDYHRDWYVADSPRKHRKRLYQGAGGEWYLTTDEKKRILLNSMYGVDIDPQAVEVTKLNLLLCVLENENQGTIRQLSLIHERALPDLAANIKCGNSLIGTDFYRGKQLALFDEETQYKINAFDWEDEFPEIFKGKNPGFDAVIGNPPYVLLQRLGTPEVFAYLSANFVSARYKIDTYQVFLQRAVEVASQGGLVGLITPNTFLMNKHAEQLRRFVLSQCEVQDIVLHDFRVFPRASVDTCTTVLAKQGVPGPAHQVSVGSWKGPASVSYHSQVRQAIWGELEGAVFNVALSPRAASLFAKIEAQSIRLGAFATAYFGIQTFDRSSNVTNEPLGPEYKPVVDGQMLARYHLSDRREYVRFVPEAIKSGGNQEVYTRERIGVRQIGRTPVASLIPPGLYTLNTIYNIYPVAETGYDLRYILGLMNSGLLAAYWVGNFSDYKKTFPKVKKGPLLSLPVRRIGFADAEDKARHDGLVELVHGMLSLQRHFADASTDRSKEMLGRQIAATDREIDRLVYELYGLTDEEIAIVEEGTRS